MVRATLLLLAMVVAVAVSARTYPSFDEYRTQFNKEYEVGSEEYATRKSTYEKEVESVAAHNSDSEQLFTRGVNKYSDWSEEELAQLRGWRHDMHLAHKAARATEPSFIRKSSTTLHKLKSKTQGTLNAKSAVLESVDWASTMDPEIPNQSMCGSCWAFAGIAAVEGALFQKTGKHTQLSVQQFVDCTANPHNCGGDGGCGGATIDLMLENAELNGIASSADYPYTSGTGSASACAAQTDKKVAKVGRFHEVKSNDLDALVEAVSRQPIAVSVDAGDWSSYEGGILTTSSPTIDHAVTLVGYGEENGVKYWKIRNSWGPDWGEKGYIRLKRFSSKDEPGFCQTDRDPKVGVGCDGGPPQVEVCGTAGILYAASYPSDVDDM